MNAGLFAQLIRKDSSGSLLSKRSRNFPPPCLPARHSPTDHGWIIFLSLSWILCCLFLFNNIHLLLSFSLLLTLHASSCKLGGPDSILRTRRDIFGLFSLWERGPFSSCVSDTVTRVHTLVMLGIWVGGSSTMSKLGLLLQVTLCLKPASHSVHALIHSEAEQNLINIKLAKHLTLSLILYLPILATELNCDVFAHINH